jgi:single-strand DNA-binding protein
MKNESIVKRDNKTTAINKKDMQNKVSAPKAIQDQLEFEPCNEVYLVGRVSSIPVEKIMPSGDKVVEFRLVIAREKSRTGKREVDTLDIAAWSSKVRKSALSLKLDTWIELDGAVRRRFWQAPGGLASRWQVEASEVRRL